VGGDSAPWVFMLHKGRDTRAHWGSLGGFDPYLIIIS
jgi:hypothetical protein